MRPQGLLTVSKITDASGRDIPLDDAVRYGWLPKDAEKAPRGWGIGREEACLGKNLWTDSGRQILCYCLAFRSPIADYVLSKFGVGTGTTAAKTTDVALEAPARLNSLEFLGNVETIDFLSPFVMRVAYTLGLADCNGLLLTEMGLFSGNGSLIARKVRSIGISKVSDYSPTICHRLRFLFPFLAGVASVFGWT